MVSPVPLMAQRKHSVDSNKPTLISLQQRDAYLLLLPLDRASAESLLKQLSVALRPTTPTAITPGGGGTLSH